MNGDDFKFGKTNEEIRTSWLKIYHDNGIKVLLSAFGATWMPTGSDAVATCNRIADTALQYQFDGVDLDYEDNEAMNVGKAEDWLIKCTRAIRAKLPVG
jgi:chitinase